MLMNRFNRAFDVKTLLKDAGAVTASGHAQVNAAAATIDLAGDPAGTTLAPTAGMTTAPVTPFDFVVDVSAITFGNADNVIRVCLQASSVVNFASDVVNLAVLELSNTTNLLAGSTVVGAVGRYVLSGYNWVNGTSRRYVRAYHIITGTSAPSINYTARLAMDKLC